MPGRRAHHARTSASRRASGSSARAQERVPGLRDRLQRVPRLRPARQQGRTATARATTWRSTSTGCATRACSRTARVIDGSRARARIVRARRRRSTRALDARRSAFARRRRNESIAVVLSAQHSIEDNFALRELAQTFIGAKAIFVTGKPHGQAATTSSCDEDKNPNTAGVDAARARARARSQQLLEAHRATATYAHVIALGGRSAGQRPSARRAARASSRTLVTIAAHDGPLVAPRHVVLPACTWAEAEGTYVNRRAWRQKSERALDPQGARARLGARGAARRGARLRHRLEEAQGSAQAMEPEAPAATRCRREPERRHERLSSFSSPFVKIRRGRAVRREHRGDPDVGRAPQSAMIQDRIGPNRAVVWLPTRIAARRCRSVVGAGSPALAARLCYQVEPRSPAVRLDAGFDLTELAVFLVWFGCDRGRRQARSAGRRAARRISSGSLDARVIFYRGLVAARRGVRSRALAPTASSAPLRRALRRRSCRGGRAVLLGGVAALSRACPIRQGRAAPRRPAARRGRRR